MYAASKEQLRVRLEARRSNATAPRRNKTKYTRKLKHRKADHENV
jgi:hypothetical protein